MNRSESARRADQMAQNAMRPPSGRAARGRAGRRGRQSNRGGDDLKVTVRNSPMKGGGPGRGVGPERGGRGRDMPPSSHGHSSGFQSVNHGRRGRGRGRVVVMPGQDAPPLSGRR